MHMKKLPDGRVVECKCGMCRTACSGEEFFTVNASTASTSQTWIGDPIQELPRPMRWYVYGAWALAGIFAIGSIIYAWSNR